MNITTVTIYQPQPQDPKNLHVWYHIKSCDQQGDRVVGILHDEEPNLVGYVPTRAGQVVEECACKLGGTVLLAYFKQAPYQSVGAGDTWVYVTYA